MTNEPTAEEIEKVAIEIAKEIDVHVWDDIPQITKRDYRDIAKWHLQQISTLTKERDDAVNFLSKLCNRSDI